MNDTTLRAGILRTDDGRGLHTIEHGTGPDLVVCEAGLGAAGASWGAVFDQLGADLRAVAYDRAGYGASDPDPRARDLARLAADLLTVIAGTPHERLVLVGHSWGGPIVRLAAEALRTRGEAVAGLVLVDPSDELADMYFSRMVRVMSRAQGLLLPVLARAGLLAPLQRAATPELPAPYSDAFLAAVSTTQFARAVRAESAHIARGLRALQLDPPEIADIPATVLSGRLAAGLGRRRRDELTAAHRARAAAHEAGRFVAAERSGHVIVASEPQLVAQEIRRLLT